MVVTSWPRLSTISARSMRDQRLVLDDQHAGGDLPVDLGERGGDRASWISASLRSAMSAASAGRKPSSVVRSSTCRLSGGMAASRSRAVRSPAEPSVSGAGVELEAVPEAVEQPVEPDLHAALAVEDRRVGDDRLEAGGHVRVAAGLRAGQRPGVAAQVGQVGSDFLRKAGGHFGALILSATRSTRSRPSMRSGTARGQVAEPAEKFHRAWNQRAGFAHCGERVVPSVARAQAEAGWSGDDRQ